MNINQKWMEKYELLKEYKEEYGHIDVPQSYKKDGVRLGIWLANQRQAYKGKGKCKISQDQIQLLEELGINWNFRDKIWEDYYELLEEYKEKYGNIEVSFSYEKDGLKLGVWLYKQKQSYHGYGTYKLTEERVYLLEKLGINWDLNEQKWMEKYELLKEYKEEHGNIDVPFSYEKDGLKLGVWLYKQKQSYHGHGTYKLTEERIHLLEKLGINWQIHDKTWEDYYELLKGYQEEYGNIDVPQSYEKDGIKLGNWLSTQRQSYKGKGHGKITQNQIKLLEELGINWNLNEQKWMEKYELLKEYKEKHGNIDVPTHYQINQINLGQWLQYQRQAYKGNGYGRITQEQIKLLEELGMNWQIYDRRWNDHYELLKEYKKKHGNINIPIYYQINQINLGKWLQYQRKAYKGQKSYVITKNQIKLLNDLEIEWNIKDTKFLQKTINDQTNEKYQQVLLERVNHIIEDLVYEGITDINATNQKEIEKIMIKRIWK